MGSRFLSPTIPKRRHQESIHANRQTGSMQDAFIVGEVYLNFATGVNRIQPNFQ